MKFLSEFRDKALIDALLAQIAREVAPRRRYTFMEVCGTHTVAIARNGLRQLLPAAIRLVSGPGCPVCVTSTAYIDAAIARAMRPEVTISTFGDMLRVPGASTTLEAAKARGADVRVVLSVLDALKLAREQPTRKVIFLGVGFETTVPTVAAALARARAEGLQNFLVASAHKTMPVPMHALASDPAVAVEGYICPGHVCTIVGLAPFIPIVARFHIPAAIAGFEPTDVLAAVLALVRQRNAGEARVENLYTRSVRAEGNPKAWRLVESVFEPADSWWRGLGVLPGSGLALREDYAAHDADKVLPVAVPPAREVAGCRCGDVLKGILEPRGCPLFDKVCTPERPVGACMVSQEGACHAAHRWGRTGM
jgi:hydrogenase expression/formation protein HypD